MAGNGARVKSIEQSIADTDEPDSKLRKELGALDLVVFGVAVAVGAGIFTLTARAAGDVAGPSVSLAFVLAAIACGLAALCYAEFASTVPVAGSAYTFSYATFGELVAWVVGWDLVLEFALAAGVVAKGWSAYLAQFLGLIGVPLKSASFQLAGPISFDWGALLIIAALTWVIATGVKLSSRVSQVITAIKIAVVLLVLVVGIAYVKVANYTPYIPPPGAASGGTGGSVLTQSVVSLIGGSSTSTFGVYGLLAAASLVFFAFIGFDSISTHAEEAKNPQRDVPIGIIVSLVLCTILYIAVAAVLTGMVRYDQIAIDAPVSSLRHSIFSCTPFNDFSRQGMASALMRISSVPNAKALPLRRAQIFSSPRTRASRNSGRWSAKRAESDIRDLPDDGWCTRHGAAGPACVCRGLQHVPFPPQLWSTSHCTDQG